MNKSIVGDVPMFLNEEHMEIMNNRKTRHHKLNRLSQKYGFVVQPDVTTNELRHLRRKYARKVKRTCLEENRQKFNVNFVVQNVELNPNQTQSYVTPL